MNNKKWVSHKWPVVDIVNARLKVFMFFPFTSSVAYFDGRCIVENRLIFPLMLKEREESFIFSHKNSKYYPFVRFQISIRFFPIEE